MKPTGWYLGLRYMRGRGLVTRVAEPVDVAQRGADFIFADEVLGTAADWRSVLYNWWHALAIGGHLILWLPDCRYHQKKDYPPLAGGSRQLAGAGRGLGQFYDPTPHSQANVTLPQGEGNLSLFTLPDVEHALDDMSGWHLHECDLIDGHIYAVWQKHADQRQMKTPWRKQPQHMLIARTGAHGDALMAGSILPWLKDQGWRISFITRDAGATVLQNDPHLDEVIILAAGQVPDEELPFYWHAWEKRFDRFLNLTHSVEGELLKQPGRADYFWSHEQRRAMCAHSYLRYLHKLAGVPGPYRVCFYPTASEKAWAGFKARSMDGFILWCLRGSAVHKWWPYGPQAVCRILTKTKLNLILTGDADAAPLAEKILQAVRDYHGDASRVQSLVGIHSIREIMTLAHHATMVVGPETGVMNAVSMQSVPKILFLSHSAPENLSNDWIATTALEPTTDCYPCHRLHQSHTWCPQDAATAAAACSASISVDRVVNAVINAAAHKPAQPYWLRGEAFGYAA